MPRFSAYTHLTLTAFSICLAACHVADQSTDPLHFATDSTYVDTELGFSLAFPKGWSVQLKPMIGEEDFLAEKNRNPSGPKDVSSPFVEGSHRKLFHATLRDYVDYWYDPNIFSYDSMHIGESQIRAGVEIIPVYVEYLGDTGPLSVRRLYFLRDGEVIVVRLAAKKGYFDSHPDLRFIDSSLTFF